MKRTCLFALAVALAGGPPRAAACPYCKVAVPGLAAAEPAADRLALSGGLDYASAYYFRGYLQADSGLIAQPYLNVFAPCPALDGALVTPYLSLFNSTDLTGRGPMSGMSDAMLGATASWHGFSVDARYAFFTSAPAARAAVHEFGAKASFQALPSVDGFGVSPFAGLYGGLFDGGTRYLYGEAGVDPNWRFAAGGYRWGVGLPVLAGFSGKDYYFDRRGRNEPFGYLSAGVTASVSRPRPAGRGAWFVNLSAQYLYLSADNLAAINGGRDAFVGKVGVGFVY